MKPKVRNFISVGGPNMGEAGIPRCPIRKFEALSTPLCNFADQLSQMLVYLPLVQESLSPADFYRYPDQLHIYKRQSSFLPYLNNEVNHSDFERYRGNIKKLNSLSLI